MRLEENGWEWDFVKESGIWNAAIKFWLPTSPVSGKEVCIEIPDIHLNRMGEHAVTGCVMLRLGFGAKFTEFNT